MSDLTDECPVSSTAEISLPHIKPFDLVTLPLRVLAKLPPQREKDPTAINHKVCSEIFPSQTVNNDLLYTAHFITQELFSFLINR